MSRSYKKTPIAKDHNSGKWGKKQANRRVRRCNQSIPNGKSYRKLYNPWDIHDYVSYCSYRQELKYRESLEKRVSQGIDSSYLLDRRGSWEKYYYRK